MATMSAAERRKYREQQKRKQGYVVGSPSIHVIDVDPPARPGGSSAQGSPPPNVQLDVGMVVAGSSAPRLPPLCNPPPAKKLKVSPSYEFGLPLHGEPSASAAWKEVMGVQKGVEGQPYSSVRSVFDARYSLNEVLSKAAWAGDVERVPSLGVKETLIAVKYYGHYISILTHLTEDALKKTLSDQGQLEKEMKNAEETLEKYRLERTRLNEDLEKHTGAKERLDREVEILKLDKKRLSDELEQAKKDREAAQLELGKCNEMLAGVAAHFPKLDADSSLVVAVGELKESIAENFETGFMLALAQMQVLYPGLDESQFDAYKIVKDGQIVEEEEDPHATNETPVAVLQPEVNAATVEEFL